MSAMPTSPFISRLDHGIPPVKRPNRFQYVLAQLGQQLPFSILGVAVALLLMGIFTFLAILMRAEDFLPEACSELFHVSFVSHILLATITTTAILRNHEGTLLKTILIGFLGGLSICVLSDIIFPFIGGKVLGMEMEMHICLIEHPSLILPFALVGVFAGFFVSGAREKSIQFSHPAHVLVSSLACLSYLIAFGVQDWIHLLGGVFIVTVSSVIVPCCLSDLVLPLCCVHKPVG